MRFLLLTIITLLPTYLIRFHIGPIPTTLLELLLLFTFFLWSIEKLRKRASRRGDTLRGPRSSASSRNAAMPSERGAMGQDPEPWQSKPYFYPIILFLLAATIAVFVAPDLRAALGLWKAYAIEPIFFFFMFTDTMRRGWPTVWRDVTIALSLSALGVAIPAIYQKWTPIGISNIHWAAAETRRVTSWYGFPNALGLYLAPIIPLLISYVFASRRGDAERGPRSSASSPAPPDDAVGAGCAAAGPQAIATIAALASLLAIIFARSEGALTALVIVGFVTGLAAARTRLFTTVVALIFIIATFTNTPWRTYLYDQITLRREAGPVRLMQWKETTRMLRDISTPLGVGRPLLGAGLSGYPIKIAPYHTAKHIEIYQYPHNIILNFWSELGLLGVISFLWIVVIFYKNILRNSKKTELTTYAAHEGHPANDGGNLQLVVLASMSVILIHGLVDVPYFKNDLAIFFWLLLALTFSVSPSIVKKKE